MSYEYEQILKGISETRYSEMTAFSERVANALHGRGCELIDKNIIADCLVYVADEKLSEIKEKKEAAKKEKARSQSQAGI